MKRSVYILCVMLCVVLLTAACSKTRNCRCSVTEHDEHRTISATNSELFINVDDIKCEDITTVGDEWIDHDGFVHSSNKVSCTEQ